MTAIRFRSSVIKKYRLHPDCRVDRVTAVFILVAMILFLLTGCSGTSAGTDPTVETTMTPASNPTDSQAANDLADRGASGVLRLWWSPHDNLNPLLDKSVSGRAVQSLIFQSLFEQDASWELKPILVKHFSFSPERLQLTLVLDDSVVFHNGQRVTASDVLACLNFIQQAGENSPFSADLGAYSSGRLVNDSTLVLQLSAFDPDFLYALTFPVVPASQLALPSGDLIAGTGRYRMADYSDEGLTLTWAADQSAETISLQKILVKSYVSATAAMKAVEDDELDLAFLPENDLANYHIRGSLRLDRFVGRRFIYLAIGSTYQSADSGSGLLGIKYFLRSARWFELDETWPGRAADLPIPAFHACFNGRPLDFEQFWPAIASGQSSRQAQSTGPIETLQIAPMNRTIQIIAPETQPLLIKIAEKTSQWLIEMGQPAEIELLTSDLYRAALSAQNYDLAACESVIPVSAEPGWLLESESDQSTLDAQGLPVAGQNGYDEDQSDLAIGWPFFGLLGVVRVDNPETAAELAVNYRQALTESALRSPYVGILLREAAVAYGDRIQGQGQPSLGQPYRGIEDLWIWSGSSS